MSKNENVLHLISSYNLLKNTVAIEIEKNKQTKKSFELVNLL